MTRASLLNPWSRAAGIALFAAFLNTPLTVFAQTQGVGDAPAPSRSILLETNPDSALAIALSQITGAPLTLAEAQAAALDQATDVREARGALMAARGTMRSQKGAFDPELFAEISRMEEQTPSASPFSATLVRSKEAFASGGARITLPTGTELTASIQTTRFEADSSFSGANPQYDAAAALEFRQPLLKGFGPAAWGRRSAAARSYDAARARYDDAVQRTGAVVEQTYWDLYAAERDLAVQRLLRDRAASFLDQAEKRGKAGIVGPSVVANARVFLSEQEQAVLDREEQYDKISDRLGSLLGRRPASGQTRYRPIDNPPREFAVEPEDSVVERSMARNRSLASFRHAVASARALARAARWNAFPQLDLFGSVGGVGLNGTPRPITVLGSTYVANISGDRGDAAADAIDRRYPNWTFGARMTIPIGFRQGMGDHQRAKGELEQAEQRYLAARRSLEERVRAAHRDLVHSVKRLDAARMGVDAALEQARIGLLEYGLGKTTSFDLVRLGADVASSQQRFSQALVRTAKAVAELRWLTSSQDAAGSTSTGNTTP